MPYKILQCKAKRQYLLTCNVSRYCLFTRQNTWSINDLEAGGEGGGLWRNLLRSATTTYSGSGRCTSGRQVAGILPTGA